MMNVFYNKAGIGDTLLISIKPVDTDNFTYEKNGEVVRIINGDNETAGFNIFHASEHFSFASEKGSVILTPELVDNLNDF